MAAIEGCLPPSMVDAASSNSTSLSSAITCEPLSDSSIVASSSGVSKKSSSPFDSSEAADPSSSTSISSSPNSSDSMPEPPKSIGASSSDRPLSAGTDELNAAVAGAMCDIATLAAAAEYKIVVIVCQVDARAAHFLAAAGLSADVAAQHEIIVERSSRRPSFSCWIHREALSG